MNRKKRFALGFKLGRAEHKTRAWGLKFLVVSAVVLVAGVYFKSIIIVIIAGVALGITILTEAVSYAIHLMEKKTMNGIRHGRARR